MNLSRRSFLGGAIALVGAAAMPKIIAAVPTVYGDGIHDDWAGLDALWNGLPANILTDQVSVRGPREIYMVDGNFVLSRTLHQREGRARIAIINSTLRWIRDVDCCFKFHSGATYHVTNNHFTTSSAPESLLRLTSE